jgi:NADPH:quinone reductase
MRAVWLTTYGGPEVLAVRETPDPIPGPADVTIRVAAAAVNFIDTLIRANRSPGPPGSGQAPPFIPGNGVGGTVVGIGSEVDASLAGTRVITSTGGSGGYAELVAVPAATVIPVPAGLDLGTATALLADGRTALGLFQAAALEPGQMALVLAAAGGVGSLLVQLCRAAAVRAIGASSVSKAAFVSGLGAEPVDYGAPGWSSRVKVDVVFDGVGGSAGGAALAALRPGGRFIQYGLAAGAATQVDREDVQRIGFDVLRAIGSRSGELTREALALAAGGVLRPTVGQTFPLEAAAAAHAAIESRATVGRTLLVF